MHLCSVHGASEQQEPLCLVNTGRRFCIFSVVFSSDGNEILGGANDGCLYIYDRHKHKRTLSVKAHFHHPQRVSHQICFLDTRSWVWCQQCCLCWWNFPHHLQWGWWWVNKSMGQTDLKRRSAETCWCFGWPYGRNHIYWLKRRWSTPYI